MMIMQQPRLAELVATLQARKLKRRDEAERRQLSVMFCDLVGSTTLSTEQAT